MYRTFLLSSLLLCGTILSSHATPPGTIDEVEARFAKQPLYRSFSSRLNFESTAGRTGAGILHYAEGPDGPHILLGLRDDEESWCNFGGMSDAQEGEKKRTAKKTQLAGLLAETASREVEEESNGYFAHHPHDVKALPYIDTLDDRKGASFIYRMYFKKVPMVGVDHLKKAQQESESHHNQEYRDFRWIPAKAIWSAIQTGTQKINSAEESISLFAPLFSTLMTPAGQALLEHLTTFSKINRFSKDLRRVLNRVYNVKSKGKEDYSEAFHWPLTNSGKIIDSELDKAQLAYAVAAHGARMTELKSRFKIKTVKNSAVTDRNDKPNLSLSQIHLRMVLGHDYKTAEDFQGTETPQRAANKANIEQYLKRYSGTDEFTRPATHTPRDVEVLADVLDFEDKNKRKPTFYHAANADINNLWQSFTFLRELLSLTPMVGEKVVMRGTDIYFKDVKAMLDILNKYGYEDYKGRELLVLCANYVLMAGLKTTKTSSSSIEYLLNDHSVITPNIEGKFEEATALAGIIARYSYYKSLFLQYLAHQNPEAANSVLVGISVPPELLTTHAYAAFGGGRKFNVYDSAQQKTIEPTVTEILKGIQDEGVKPLQDFKEDTARKTQLIPEVRLSMHPDFALHPDVEIKTFNRFPLSPSQQKDFDREMRATSIATLADWLKSQYKVMPDSFQAYPTLKKLFAYVWKGVTGEDLEETFAYESFTHLLANGHMEGARDFLSKYPEVANHDTFNPKAISQALIRANKAESFKFMMAEVVHKSVGDFYATPKDYYIAIRTALIFENHEFLDYLLENYDLTKIPSNIVTSWFNMAGHETDSHRFVLAKHFPEFKEKARKHFLNSPFSEEAVSYVKFSGENSHDVVRDILKKSSQQRPAIHQILKLLELQDINLSDLTVHDFDEFAKNEYFYQQDQIDLLISKGLKPSVLLEITMTHCAYKGCLIPYSPYWLFAFMARDDLDVESLKTPMKNLFQKSCLSDEQLNLLISGGFVTAQNVFDWSLEKNELSLHGLLSVLKPLTSASSLTLNAENTLLLSEHLMRVTYINSDDVDFLLNLGMPPLALAKSLIAALNPEITSMAWEMKRLVQTHPEVFAELESQEVLRVIQNENFSEEELSQIISNVKDQDALLQAVEVTQFKNYQEISRLFIFAQVASMDPRKIPDFSLNRLFSDGIYLNDDDLEFLAKNDFGALDVFKAALTPRMLEYSSWPLVNFAKNHMDELKEELTDDEKKALQEHNTDVFIAAIKKRYQIADVPEETTPVASLASEPVADGVVDVAASTAVAPDWDSLHGDDFLKALKGTLHHEIPEFLKDFKGRIDQTKAEIKASQDPEITRGMMAELLALDDYELSLNALQKTYANVDDFMALEFTASKNGVMWQKPLQFVFTQYGGAEVAGPFLNSAKAIIEYLGANLPGFILKDVSLFTSILNSLSENNEDLIRQLWTQYTELFTHKDDENDFFDMAFKILDGPILEEFALHYQGKLKEHALDGNPYFWYAAMTSESISDQMIEYIAKNPDVLKLKALDSISFEDYLCDILDRRADYEKGSKEIKGKLKRREN